MGENSKIEWTDHTFNPWIGCQHVSPGCDHCYAEAQNNFRKWNGGSWGPHAHGREQVTQIGKIQ
jgi:phage protein Gp37/Gp68